MQVKGTFEVKAKFEPPYDTVDGVVLLRASFDKRFLGPLEATSHVEMLAARGPKESSAAYVAMERVSGSLVGVSGSFVLQHTGQMNAGQQSLRVVVVADSGTGALSGLRGEMQIDILEGTHHYTFDYNIGDP